MGNSFNTVQSFYLASDLIVLKTITPLHAGVGRAGKLVDLPIQRDEYGFPCIYSSSLKGALKTAQVHAFLRSFKDCRDPYSKALMAVQALLGPDPEEGESFESSIALLDAYLLAMPVRSLKGIYVYVTSPILLKRFYERLELLASIPGESRQGKGEQTGVDVVKKTIDIYELIAKIDPGPRKAICMGEDKDCENLRVKELKNKIVLAEEYFLEINLPENITKEQISKMNTFVKNIFRLDKPLLIVDDFTARDLVERSILRLTRVRLRRETKTFQERGLWSEEYLPPKTVLHSIALYKKPSLSNSFVNKILGSEKNKDQLDEEYYLEALKKLQILNDRQAEDIKSGDSIIEKMQIVACAVRNKVRDLINVQLGGYLILGGHETIGKGIVSIKLCSLKDLQKCLKGEIND